MGTRSGAFAEALAEAKADTAKYIETLKEKGDHSSNTHRGKGADRGAKETQAGRGKRQKK